MWVNEWMQSWKYSRIDINILNFNLQSHKISDDLLCESINFLNISVLSQVIYTYLLYQVINKGMELFP